MDILGDSLDKIAFEKAGIIKPGIPVVIGETIPETKVVFQDKASETGSPIFFSGDKYQIVSAINEAQTLEVVVENVGQQKKQQYSLDLNGLYQQKNLLTVLTAIDIVRNKFPVKDDDIHLALMNVKKYTGLNGRWDIIHKDPLVVLDVAHNEDGIKNLTNQINHTRYNELHIVFGIVKDKEIEKVLSNLPAKATYYFTKAQIERALPEDELLERAGNFNLQGNSYREVNEALKAAMASASKDDLIIVCGSVFVVGEVNMGN